MPAPAAPAVFLGVRHHSPACARLVADTIRTLRPACVLVEGPADMNARMDELLLGHTLPVAVFSHYRDDQRVATSWTPLCDYSPEWIALREGRAAGAEVRFIDLPAWHPAVAGHPDRYANRYADAEARYAEATRRLCEHFAVDSPDALWDGLFEVTEPGTGPQELRARLDAYFELVRGDADADSGDQAREEYMASWVRAALARAGDRPVLVVTGGFHQPALRALSARHAAAAAPADWPAVPEPPQGALGGSFLVPYSFRQLDAFAGYQSGMPSPGYYQRLWERGPEAAGQGLLRAVTERLRARGIPLSTADLIAARSLSQGLARLRGHPCETRVDVLDGLAGALITDDLDRPLPWTTRGTLGAGTHPVVVEMVAACTGEAVGRLHPDTPLPPLVHDAAAHLAHLGLADVTTPVTLDLTKERDLSRSRALHRLRVLDVPGFTRVSGPAHGVDPVFTEVWEPRPAAAGREAALIEAGAYGARLDEAAAALLGKRTRAAGPELGALAGLLFDTVLCGTGPLCADLLTALADQVGQAGDLGPLGEVLSAALGLWRHDRVFGVARDGLLGAVVGSAADRVFRLAEGLHGGPGADLAALRALAAARDALRHAPALLSVTPEAAAEAAARISRDPRAPAALRGAAFGLRWALGVPDDPGPVVQALAAAAVDTLGDWLTGLFAVAREEVAHGTTTEDDSLIDIVDGVVSALPEAGFLGGLPALRQAFSFFPPRERERIAERLLHRRSLRGSARSLLRTPADPLLLARARALEENVTRLLDRHGLAAAPVPGAVSAPPPGGARMNPAPPDPPPAPTATPPAPDPGLERWRLILGAPAERCTGPLHGTSAARDAALDWLYGRDDDLRRRGVRRGAADSREGGSGPSRLTPVDWLDDIHRLFPKETVERLERDAVEQYEIHEIVTDPDVLARVEPSQTLLRAVLRTKHLMNPQVLAAARRIVETVVRQLMERLQPEVRRAFTGSRTRRPSRLPLARDFDFRTTIRANLAHYQPEERRILIQRPRFHSRTRRHLEQWQLVLLVDQSGSMAGSVIHSAVTAACLWSLPGLKTHLVAFDTAVVDLTSEVTDPVELLMRVQLGGGTDIARAVDYGASLVENPRRTIVALVSDFYEGGDPFRLVRTVRHLVEQGTTVLCLAALDEAADPVYDRDLAGRLAAVGAPVGAMTPGRLAEFVAERIGRGGQAR